MQVTIKDVAKLSNVSATSVSLILNNKPVRVSKKTRDRVIKAAKELGYKPNPIAVALITKKSRTIGLVLPNIGNTFFSELSKFVEKELDQHGYSLLFGNTMGTSEKDLNYLDMFINRGVDGVVFVRSSKSSGNYALRFQKIVETANIPIVLLDRLMDEPITSSVSVDHEHGGYIATKHLIELGHRSIGCITAEPSLGNVIMRLNGYKRALAEAGIPFDPDKIVSGNFSIATGRALAPQLLEKNITAIFAFNDLIGIGAYQACRQAGLRVPQDISIIGYDDIIYSEVLDTPLTTIHQPIEQMAKEAIDLLLSLIDSGDTCKKSIVFQPELIKRSSCAAPRSEDAPGLPCRQPDLE